MKCECGNEISIQMGAKVLPKGCRILTALTVVVTIQCENCSKVFQVPIKSSSSITKKD
jgi:hypothetical protein